MTLTDWFVRRSVSFAVSGFAVGISFCKAYVSSRSLVSPCSTLLSQSSGALSRADGMAMRGTSLIHLTNSNWLIRFTTKAVLDSTDLTAVFRSPSVTVKSSFILLPV